MTTEPLSAGARDVVSPTPEQIELARHALGLPNDRRRSYRNRYLAGGPSPEWSGMVDAGMAERGETCSRGMTWFWLTRAGAQAVLKRGERLCSEDFPLAKAGA